jgi:hypothetical protein
MVVQRISSHVVATHTVTDFIDVAVDEEACMKANQIKPGMYFRRHGKRSLSLVFKSSAFTLT